MANIEKLIPYVLKWEGGFVNNPKDPGGATNMGVTMAVWKSQGYDKNGDRIIDVKDLKLITVKEVTMIMKKSYWDRWLADNIKSQAVANILVDWVWCSGKWGIVIPQRLLGLKEDGIVGYLTLEALNETILENETKFIEQLYTARKDYILDIINHNPSLATFKKGWFNRLEDLKKTNLKYL
jgi:lysozyme family protein